MAPKPISQDQLNKLIAKVLHDEEQKEELQLQVEKYNQAFFQLVELKRNFEWKLILEPSLFKKAEQKLTSACKDLKSGHVLDTRSSDWTRHMEQYKNAVDTLKEQRIDKKIKNKFKSYFEGRDQKAKADEFVEAYNNKMAALELEREEWRNKYDQNGDPLYDPIMEIEVEKQLKIVQAHMIQAMQAVTAAEKAKRLSLAKEALAGVGIAVAGAGLGMTAAAAAGSLLPVWGTVIAGVIGGAAGGIFGGIRAFRNYEIAKAALQARVDKVLGVIAEYPKIDNATLMNPGIAQLKSLDTFDWLVGGPRKADFQRMYEKYASSGKELEESDKNKLDVMLQSKFAEDRGAYFLMLQDMIREGAADTALQVAAGLTPIAPFDPYAALLISSQFTIMCTAQIGTARAMANLDPIDGMPMGHVPVGNNKELLHEAAAGLASNAECLISLAHQINISTTIEQKIRAEMLADVHAALASTIEAYNDVVTKHHLPLQKDLVEALKNGISADIKNKGLKITVGNEKHTSSTKHLTKQEKKAYAAGASTLKYLKSEAMQDPSAAFHHLKPSKLTNRPHLEKALTGADYFMNAVIGPALGIYGICIAVYNPLVMNPEAPETVELGHTGTTVEGFTAGITLGVLALACGVGSAICGIKAEQESAKVFILGDVAERRRIIHSKLHHSERGSAGLAQRADDELRTLLDNPEYQLRLYKTQPVGLAVQGEAADRARELFKMKRTSHLRTVGMWRGKEVESHRPIPPGRKEQILEVVNGGLQFLSNLPQELEQEINVFDEKDPNTDSPEKGLEKIKNFYKEAALHIDRMKQIINALHGLPDGTDQMLVDNLDNVLSELKTLEEMTARKYAPTEDWEEEEPYSSMNRPNLEDFKIKELYDQIDTFKSSIPEGPKDLRGEAMDKLRL